MIRLTFNANFDPEIHLFNKSIILLGADSNQVDVVLPQPCIQPIHLKIVEQNGFPILVNHVNDPFVSVNGHPFGKKLLNTGDIIVIHQIPILFENLKMLSEDKCEESTNAQNLTNEIISSQANDPSSMNGGPYSSFSLPFEKEVDVLKEEEMQQIGMDSYLMEVETKTSIVSKEEVSVSTVQKKPLSLKDDYLRDLEDDNQKMAVEDSTEPSHLYQAWKWILLFIFSLITISGGLGTILYFSVSDKSEAQETKAAQAVADIAISLAYAQLSSAKPPNQNWSDVDFIKNNLQSILPETSSYASQIDVQGQLNCCPYNLRIYTSSDLSHFLLIAQPAPNFLYWLIPQSIIVVDSHLMELRSLQDVRGLNRLLTNSDPLEGIKGKEITALVKQGKLIHLSTLAADSGHLDFSPPKNLSWIRPGAENYIYNAPRYYRLGNKLTQRAISLSSSKGSSKEVAALKQEVKNSDWLNHFILYTDQGKKNAQLVRQSLMMFAPSDRFLFGYLSLNAQGKIHQAHLLKEEEDEESKEASLHSKENDLIAFEPFQEVENNELSKKNSEINIDRNHPVYIQLHALVSERETELKPIIKALFTLMNQELQMPKYQFQLEFQNLSHTYLMVNHRHKKVIKATLDLLYKQYENIPTTTFVEFIHELHLNNLTQQDNTFIERIEENCQHNMEILLKQIENCKTLTELDNLVHIAGNWLQFDYIENPNALIKYQNLLRNKLLTQLEEFLITQKKPFRMNRDRRELLEHLLSQERLIQPEEREFFLEEFEAIVLSKYPTVSKQ